MINDNQLVLLNGKIITFNEEQYIGIGRIREFLKNKNKRIFTLAGYAGTGKTTIIKKILDEFDSFVVVSAPTHKAKKVIENTTDIKGETLHSLLGLRPDVNLDDYNPNNPDFHPIALPSIHQYNLVIIDESSMINEDLYFKILNEIKISTVKIIFMGDPAQIPPVGEKESIVFNNTNDLHDYYELTIIERQQDSNPLSYIHDVLRNNLNKINGGYQYDTKVNERGEGIIFTDNRKEFRKLIMEKFKSPEFKKTMDYAKVIAWKNVTVMSSNKVIRTELFGKDADIVEIGDILMAYRSIRSSNGRYNIIENSTDYRVDSKKELSQNEYGIWGYDVVIGEELPHGKYKTKKIFIIDITNNDNVQLYAEKHDYYKKIGKDKKLIDSWSQYNKFRRKNILMKNITTFSDGKPRSKYDKINKDMDYGMAITSHKAQGSTYHHVFVLENDINDNRQVKERNQLKYTSFTRPTISATVLIDKE